jgi:hypothetical protein
MSQLLRGFTRGRDSIGNSILIQGYTLAQTGNDKQSNHQTSVLVQIPVQNSCKRNRIRDKM